jgi:Tfp pilus assembly protein FimT
VGVRDLLPVRATGARGFSVVEVLVACAITAVVAAMGIPMAANEMKFLRSSGDARSLVNSIMIAKMRAAASFTQGRIYIDLTNKRYRIETWNKTTNAWTADAGWTYLSTGVSFGYGSVTTPPGTLTSLGQSGSCLGNTGTAVVQFSRDSPITGGG